MIETKGETATEEWVKGLVGNFARQPEGNDTDQIKAVAAGICDVALVNHYYVARLQQSDVPQDQQIAESIGVIFPDLNQSGTHINISGAGVVEGAPHPQNAVEFIEFLATPEAQEIFANNNNEYPVIAELEPNPTVTSLGEFETSSLDISAYGENNADAVVIMDRGGWK
jgi:iron(III) transport system substrate-binding protein